MENDIKQFAEEIKEKILVRQRKRGWSDMSYPEALYDMIVFKMKKENWERKKL